MDTLFISFLFVHWLNCVIALYFFSFVFKDEMVLFCSFAVFFSSRIFFSKDVAIKASTECLFTSLSPDTVF